MKRYLVLSAREGTLLMGLVSLEHVELEVSEELDESELEDDDDRWQERLTKARAVVNEEEAGWSDIAWRVLESTTQKFNSS